MFERIGIEARPEMEGYLRARHHENILLLSDIARDPLGLDIDTLDLVGYRHRGSVVGVQGFYRYGRWLPHYSDPLVLDTMIAEMLERRSQWLMGVRHIVDPLLEKLLHMGFRINYDEIDHLCYVDKGSFCAYPMPGVRRATNRDAPAIARMRFDFEVEYFGADASRISRDACLRIARRYIYYGTQVAERDKGIVCMVATEARIPEVTQIGAVYTRKRYRRQGLAKGVVSAMCEEQLRAKERVSLTVKVDNTPALRAYTALGFTRWDDFRMCRLERVKERPPRYPGQALG